MSDRYRGWAIAYRSWAPVTGRWRAMRWGVSMCAASLDALKRMVDARIYEGQERNRERSRHG